MIARHCSLARLEIANSPNVGVCFCVGCWLEGGAYMGNGVLESIRLFAEQGKLFKVHFRNVDAPRCRANRKNYLPDYVIKFTTVTPF